MTQADPAAPPSPIERQRGVDWRAVATFYLLACAFSWPFFWLRDVEPAVWAAWEAPRFVKTLSYMAGPAIAALICLFLFRRTHRRTITLWGTSAGRSAAFYLVPLAALLLAYAPEIMAGNAALLIASLVAGSFVLIIGEELGWRGFLQDALRPLPRISRYALLGAMWEIWHFTNRTHQGPLMASVIRVLIWIVILIALCWIIGEAVERSKSLTVAVTLHAWVNILAGLGDFFAASPVRGMVVFGCSVLFWLFLLRSWPRPAAEPPPQT